MGSRSRRRSRVSSSCSLNCSASVSMDASDSGSFWASSAEPPGTRARSAGSSVVPPRGRSGVGARPLPAGGNRVGGMFGVRAEGAARAGV